MFAATRGANAPLDPNSAFYVGGTTGASGMSLSGLGLAQGDLVVAVVTRNGTTACSISTSGYTSVTSLSNFASVSVRMLVAYKVMGATPDSSLSFSGNTAAVQAWRNIDQVTPLAATTTTAVGAYPDDVNSPSISFSGGCIILSTGGLARTGSTGLTGGPSGMSNIVIINGTNLASAGIASVYSTAGTYDPAAFGTSNGGGETWCAATLALKLA